MSNTLSLIVIMELADCCRDERKRRLCAHAAQCFWSSCMRSYPQFINILLNNYSIISGKFRLRRTHKWRYHRKRWLVSEDCWHFCGVDSIIRIVCLFVRVLGSIQALPHPPHADAHTGNLVTIIASAAAILENPQAAVKVTDLLVLLKLQPWLSERIILVTVNSPNNPNNSCRRAVSSTSSVPIRSTGKRTSLINLKILTNPNNLISPSEKRCKILNIFGIISLLSWSDYYLLFFFIFYWSCQLFLFYLQYFYLFLLGLCIDLVVLLLI
jgi:hypothetical protein